MTTFSIYHQNQGNSGSLQALERMREMVNKSFLYPTIRDRAAQIIGSHASKDLVHQRLTTWVKTHINYVADPSGVEALHDPVTWYEPRFKIGRIRPYGDCDDMSIYLASLLKAVGHSPSFYAISRRPDKLYHHVMVLCDGALLDPTRPVTMLDNVSASVTVKI